MIPGSRYLLILAVSSLSLWSGGAWTSHVLSRTSPSLGRSHIPKSALATQSTSRHSVAVVRRSPHPIFHSVTMVTGKVGWGLSATQQVLHTTDSQKSWAVVSPAHPRVTPLTLTALTTTHAMLIGAPRNLNRSAVVWTTDNVGQHWQTTRLPGAVSATGATTYWWSATYGWVFLALEYSNTQKPPPGYPPPDARGIQAVLYRTVDGGARWTIVPSTTLPNEANVNDVAFTSVKTGWLLAMTEGPGEPMLYRTQDGGADWSSVALSVPPALAGPQAEAEPLSRPVFATSQIGAVLTTIEGEPVVYTTTDGGYRWQWVLLPPSSATISAQYLNWHRSTDGWRLNVLDVQHHVIAQWVVGA
ncbi:MAG: YCF48-related protein [Firmicutes bacterium]|nr:YCF48-related protein [Bacillota bacterium]